MRKFLSVVPLFFFLVSFPFQAFADSNYVLPYPSFMPGSIAYKLHLTYEKIEKYWYFGDFGQFDYNLKQSDRYLVVSKVLFEYKQYLLAYNALKKSNQYFYEISPNLENAKKNKKNISEKLALFENASLKHIETLKKVDVPSSFIWTPEKSPTIELNLQDLIRQSIKLRENML